MRNVLSGVMATENDNTNCDEAKSVGQIIQESIDDICFENATVKCKNKVSALNQFKSRI